VIAKRANNWTASVTSPADERPYRFSRAVRPEWMPSAAFMDSLAKHAVPPLQCSFLDPQQERWFSGRLFSSEYAAQNTDGYRDNFTAKKQNIVAAVNYNL
jgi:hypothetical protein